MNSTHRMAVGAITIASALASQASANPFTDWNLIVRHDIALSTSEVDGSALIGGSLLNGTSNYAVRTVTSASGDGLAIGGMLTSPARVQVNNSGNFRINSSASIQGTANINGGSTVFDAGVAAQAASLADQAASASAFLSGLATTGTITGDANNANFIATSTVIDGMNVAVFNITSDQFQQYGTLGLSMSGADSVIINIAADASGHVDLTAPPNLVGDFSQANSSRILWNAYDATSVTVNNNLNGALFAAGASLDLLGGGINGTVVVDSIDAQLAEIRLSTYEGYVPTPGTAGVLAAAGLVAVRRRRR